MPQIDIPSKYLDKIREIATAKGVDGVYLLHLIIENGIAFESNEDIATHEVEILADELLKS